MTIPYFFSFNELKETRNEPASLGTSLTDSSVTLDTTYYYVVEAVNPSGMGQLSVEASAIISEPIVPVAPTFDSIGFTNNNGGQALALSTLESQVGLFYQLMSTPDFETIDWLPEGSALVGTGGPLLFEIAVDHESDPRKFYRVDVSATNPSE